MKKAILALFLFLLCIYGNVQTRELTIEDALVNNHSSLAVKNLRGRSLHTTLMILYTSTIKTVKMCE